MTEPEQKQATPEILSDIRDGVLWITLNRPQARNALTFGMYQTIAEICRTAPTDGTVHAVVLHGAGGKAFGAGTDIGQFRDFRTAEDALDYETKMDSVLEDIERCPLPTIAALHGAATGGGAAIAAACDIRIASASLKFGFPIARTLGNCLAAANLQRLSDLMGAGRVREMIFTARLIGAEEAQAIGLVTEVLKDEAALIARAGELGTNLKLMAPLTLRATKEAQRRSRASRRVDDSDLIALCYTSADFRTGMEAFLEKQTPKWQGK